VASEFVRDAQLDLEPLRRHVERDRRLGWWRHASDEPNR
jgi:hypothetical protein